MLAIVLSISACNSDSPDSPDNPNPGTENPNTPVADPAGTITLKMRNADNGYTGLDAIHIDRGNNFEGWDAEFVDVGFVAGLGNVTSIPKVGWTSKIAVNPGHGYVAYSGGRFYRIYVTGWTVTTGDLIIGAEVKYQKPFQGVDELLKVNPNNLSFTSEVGGAQSLLFENNSIIPFSVATENGEVFINESEYRAKVPGADWIIVEKCSSADKSFLYNGIRVTVAPGHSTEAQQTTLKLITSGGKTTSIKVTRTGAKPFISVGETLNIDNKLSLTVPFSTNIPFNQLSVTSDQPWLKVSIIDESAMLASQALKVKWIGNERKTSARSGEEGVISYSLLIQAEDNFTGDVRNASVTLQSSQCSANIAVTQQPKDVYIEPTDGEELFIEPAASENTYTFTSSLPKDMLKVTTDASWLKIEEIEGEHSRFKIKYTVAENTGKEVREANMTIFSTVGNLSTRITIKQRPNYVTVESSEVYFDRQSGTMNVNYTSSLADIAPVCNADWCKFTYTNNALTIIIKANEEGQERIATITFADGLAELKVIQSKYAVGDKCDEYGIEATVCRMDGAERFIVSLLDKWAEWSTITTVTGANSADDGQYNMDIIRKMPSWKEFFPAFAAVDELNKDGVSGWFLPASKQIRYCYSFNFSEPIWTSTEKDANNSYYAYLNSTVGYNSYGAKKTSMKIIAMRKF